MKHLTMEFLSDLLVGSQYDIGGHIMLIWGQVKMLLVVPFVRIFMYINLVMSIMLFTEKVYMAIVVAGNKLFGKKPEERYKWEPFEDDIELGNSVYPLVLVQVPMFNEREVYQLSIGAACGLSWPSDRIVIQVLDDSTDPLVKGMVEMECQSWKSKGVNIHYQVRDNRKGYKAGALKEGLKHEYAKQCEYVVIFDADFQPEPDFLMQTIPFLHHNAELGLVQARWKFGTAGVWRMAALDEAGGWKDRTTVEDMDLAVRATLKGWKFLYIGTLMVKNELPSVLKAYRYQQHRWSCGPANLFRKMFIETMRNKRVTWWKKFYVLYSFFFVRKIVAHIVTFTLYCVVIPLTVLVPEVEIPSWGTIYIPTVITLLNAVGTPRSFYLVVFWVLFENVMSMHRTKATFIGLLETQRVNEWVVTEKQGDASKAKAAAQQRQSRFKIGNRILMLELCVGIVIFGCACYDLAYGKYHYYIYLYLQAIAFLTMGFGYIGTQVSSS
ncbi:glucomannan 4-beta-mannosyltransferase 9-like isoform X1 [Bidens hawaiensis]|uniref:glucomannan 4-beta-mannosyltransferase 9-like isoform X1 n=1 Tax=Bidens hawaiensis TaxID=980011 RepID=UPI00404B78C5